MPGELETKPGHIAIHTGCSHVVSHPLCFCIKVGRVYQTASLQQQMIFDNIMEAVRVRRRPRRQVGLEAPAKAHLAQQIANVVTLSLQQNGRESGSGRLSGPLAGTQGRLASTLRLAEKNVADMTAYLRQRKAKTAAIVATSREEVTFCCEDEEQNVCVICLEGNLEEERVEALPCGHVFHAECIAQWLLYQRVCPVDRRSVDEGDVVIHR